MTGPIHTVSYEYEPGRNAMTSVENLETVGTESLVSQYEYSYNEVGQRKGRTQTGTALIDSSDDFNYDGLGQVTNVVNSVNTTLAWNPLYAYDDIGNRDGTITDLNGAVDYTADLLNQYDAIGTDTPTYDVDGNLSSRGDWTFTWNGENRLIEATDGVNTLRFEYDTQGRLVKKTENGFTEIYLYDGWNRIATFAGAAPSTTYVWGLDLSGSLQGAGGVGGLLKEGALYPLYDANGNIMQKLDATASVQMNVTYDPFGNIIDGTLVGEYGFSTKPLLNGVNLYYYGFRYYDPETGRWPNRDPIGERGGLNLYVFAINNSLSFIDVLGLSSGSDKDGGKGPAHVQYSKASELNQVMVLGYVGDGANPENKESGVALAVAATVELKKYDVDLYKWGTYSDAVLARLKEHVDDGRKKKNCFMTIIIVGHSYGGDRAFSVANWFEDQLNSEEMNFPHKIHLFSIDSIIRGTRGIATSEGPDFSPETFQNYYQTDGESIYKLIGGSIPGAENTHVRGTQHTAIDNDVAGVISKKIIQILNSIDANEK
ncbi:RHS repeat-associated core domain-containing protein [Kiritimatiellota bacterium B12222]|nr:RHS repeat-associated core domain-containing protein [Kiritimatiellota bacterium B12222]